MKTTLSQAASHLDMLCTQIHTRQVGSQGNRQATQYAAEVLRSLGYQVETPSFQCVDWIGSTAVLTSGNRSFEVFPSPYSTACQITAPLHAAGTLAELQSLSCQGELLLLRHELTREQLMPKNFPFYNPEIHQLILGLLESKNPAGIITATGRNPELAGAVYPFPLIEDGDFNIPSVYATEETGLQLLQFTGHTFSLDSRAERIPSTGCNVVVHINPRAESKIVICAHIDAKIGTPGALDNAAGVITLLLVADLLREYAGAVEIEYLLMNGEDYYGANGEKLYLEENAENLGRIVAFINIDAPGFREGKTAFSFFNQMRSVLSTLRPVLQDFPDLMEGEPWYQGDHMIVAMNGIPAVAVTSEKFMEIEQNYAHTASDVPALIDLHKLVNTALAVRKMIDVLSRDVSTD